MPVIGGERIAPHNRKDLKMKLATLASTALATVLVAGSALAYAPAQDDVNVPNREYQIGVVSSDRTEGQKITVDTASVYEGSARALISDETVNQYVFSADTDENDYGNRYR
jgi:hypothetical protein